MPELRGREAIRRHLASVVDDLAAATTRATLRHHVSSIRIELTGPDSASATSYFAVYTEVGLDHWGRYGDRFVRVDAQWLLEHRRVRVDGATPSSRLAVKQRVVATREG